MTERITSGRYPGYDVMSKRESQSWNDKTREVIDARLATESHPFFFCSSPTQCKGCRPAPSGARM
jgi:hypothetical protein